MDKMQGGVHINAISCLCDSLAQCYVFRGEEESLVEKAEPAEKIVANHEACSRYVPDAVQCPSIDGNRVETLE